mmetsp:Transcript_130465/g.225589  ORF Transcript_130465/g.225589 Transcript_130465/m.225589 type:complete len:229 (-) Transcript_130465:308-994(-)
MKFHAARHFSATFRLLYNPYTVLGLSSTASSTEVKSKYHEMAKKYHPDRTGGDDRRFKDINKAYEMLRDGKYTPSASFSSQSHSQGHNPFTQHGANPNDYYQSGAWRFQGADNMGSNRGQFYGGGGGASEYARQYMNRGGPHGTPFGAYSRPYVYSPAPQRPQYENFLLRLFKIYLVVWFSAVVWKWFVVYPIQRAREANMVDWEAFERARAEDKAVESDPRLLRDRR